MIKLEQSLILSLVLGVSWATLASGNNEVSMTSLHNWIFILSSVFAVGLFMFFLWMNKNTKKRRIMELSNEDIRELIEEAIYDEVGLWMIIKYVKRMLETEEPKEIQKVTLNAVRQLLESGEVEAGDYYYGAVCIDKWSLGIDETVTRIESEWNNLEEEGNEDHIGFIVVFVEPARK